MAVAVMLTAVFVSIGQEKARTLEYATPFKNEPLKIINVTLNGRSFLSFTDFSGDKDWLRRLEFTVQNVSDRKIVHFIISLDITNPVLPRQFGMVSGAFGMPIGILPDDIFEKRKKVLAPGDSIKVSPDPYMLARLDTYLKENPTDEITHAKVRFNMVLFEDKTGWNSGSILVRDPNDSKRWVEKKP